MFARTPRLLLRPGFPEDAPALAGAIGDKLIALNLAVVPWPYTLRDAEAFLASPRDPVLPSFLIFERTDDAPRLVGSCGLGRRPSGAVEMGYWIARPHWGRGLATEACRALIGIARALGIASLEGSHFIDNPASARVLEKLGFEPRGLVAPRMSCARGEEVPARLMRLRLNAAALEEDEALAA
jgi:RimJ/RimL family protein N-acetyltransferase